MATNAMCSNMSYAVIGKGFRMACLTLSTHFLQSFFESGVLLSPNSGQIQGCGGTSKLKWQRIRWRASLQRSRADSFLYLSFRLFVGNFCNGGRCAAKMHIIPCNPWHSLAHFNESCFDKNPYMTIVMPGLPFSFILKIPARQ